MSPTAALALYATHLRACNAAPRTIRLRLDHAREIAHLAPLHDLTAEHLELWMHPTGRHYAAETIKSRRSSARRFLRWLHQHGHLPTDPSSLLHPVKVIAPPPRVAPDGDVLRALTCCTDRDRAAILLARYGCLRLTELTTLRIEHRSGDALCVNGKGGRVRIVYMHPELARALDVLEGGQSFGWYFPGVGTASHMHPQAMHKAIKRVTGWHPHALRHAGASAAYRSTHDLRAVQLFLGHASLATTQRYLSLDEDALRAVAGGVAIGAPRAA